MIVFGWFTLETSKRQSVFVEDACSLKIVDDFFILFERTSDLFPRNELRYLFCELPEFFKVYVSIRQSGKKCQKSPKLSAFFHALLKKYLLI